MHVIASSQKTSDSISLQHLTDMIWSGRALAIFYTQLGARPTLIKHNFSLLSLICCPKFCHKLKIKFLCDIIVINQEQWIFGLEFSCVPKQHLLIRSGSFLAQLDFSSLSSTSSLLWWQTSISWSSLARSPPRWTPHHCHIHHHHYYGGKRVSLDPLRPTPLLAGLPPAGVRSLQ